MKDNRLLSRSSSWLHARRRELVLAAVCGLGSTMLLLVGCGPVKLVASTNIPQPLVVKIPIGVALFIPAEFSSYVHKEERWSTKWHVDLGKAQTEGITRLMSAMFERVVPVDSINDGTQVPGGVAAILEPSIEEYAFVTPRDAGSPFYAVSIKYRVNVYMPDGKLADSWGFTGYGTAPSQGLSSEAPLSVATSLAMRDAGAKLAVEFREQAVMRGLLPESDTADSPASAATPAAPGAAPSVTTLPPTEAGDEPADKQTDKPEDNGGGDNAGAASEPATSEAANDSPAGAPSSDPKSQEVMPVPNLPGAAPAQTQPREKNSTQEDSDQEDSRQDHSNQGHSQPGNSPRENPAQENPAQENSAQENPAQEEPVPQNEDAGAEPPEVEQKGGAEAATPLDPEADPEAVALTPPTS